MHQYDTSHRLRDAAVKVASSFLARDEELTDGVVKVAQEQGFTTDQARRVCERANHLVHAALRKQASTVDFTVADPKAVAERLGAIEKVATRYFEPADPVRTKVANDDEEDEDEDEKTVRKREKEHKDQREKEAAAAALVELRETDTLAQGAYEEAQEGVFDELMKHAADGLDLAETMEIFAGYAPLASAPNAMVCVAGLVKAAHATRTDSILTFTPRTMEILSDEKELEKVATELDPALTNPGLQISGAPVTFIRGRHAIWESIDTLLCAYATALCSQDAVARAALSPDHVTPAPMRRSGARNHVDRDVAVAGRTV